MYEYLEGRLVTHHPARVVLDVGGVGYDVAVPLGSSFPKGADERVRVWTHLVVREDAHNLFGFQDVDQRELFRMLLSVRGVGPGLALAILSTLPPNELLAAVGAEDVRAFQRVKGVGKKTAEQILLDLRDKAPGFLPEPAGADGTLRPQAPPAHPHIRDAVQALVSIGYTDKQAEKSVERAVAKGFGDDLEALVRGALQE